jgi:hypothetical protein
LEDNIGDGLRPPGGGDRGRELAAADLGFEGFLGEGWGRCTGLRGEGRAGAGGGQTHRSPDQRGKNRRGNADVRGGGANARATGKTTYQVFIVSSFFLVVEIETT